MKKLLVMLMLVVSCVSYSSPMYTARKIVQEANEYNELRFKSIMDDRGKITISGTVKDIRLDIFDNPVLELKGSGDDIVSITLKDMEKAMYLDKGDNVQVECVYNTQMEFMGLTVMFRKGVIK